MSGTVERRLERLEANAQPVRTSAQDRQREILRLADSLFTDPEITWTDRQLELLNHTVRSFSPDGVKADTLALPPSERWAVVRPHLVRAAGDDC